MSGTKGTCERTVSHKPLCIMDGPLKELAKLERLTSNASSKGKSPSINDSLDSLLYSLREVKDRLQAGSATDETLNILAKTVEGKKKDVDDRQKEVYNTLAKLGKALDKVCVLHYQLKIALTDLNTEILDAFTVLFTLVCVSRSKFCSRTHDCAAFP